MRKEIFYRRVIWICFYSNLILIHILQSNCLKIELIFFFHFYLRYFLYISRKVSFVFDIFIMIEKFRDISKKQLHENQISRNLSKFWVFAILTKCVNEFISYDFDLCSKNMSKIIFDQNWERFVNKKIFELNLRNFSLLRRVLSLKNFLIKINESINMLINFIETKLIIKSIFFYIKQINILFFYEFFYEKILFTS